MNNKGVDSKINKIAVIYTDTKAMANNTRYVYRKYLGKEISFKIKERLGKHLFSYLPFLIDSTNETTNVIDFDFFKKYAGIKQDALNRIRPRFKDAHIIKKIKIKGYSLWYLNPMVSHWGAMESTRYLYNYFREDFLKEYS